MNGRVIVLRGDAASLPLPDASVDLIVTSPPYWQQRDYRDGGESLKGQIGNEETWQEYIANLLTCTREWVRVLKPVGSIFVVIGDKYATRYSSLRQGGRAGLNDDDDTRRRSGANHTGVSEKSLIGLPWRYALACMDELGLLNRRDNLWHKTAGMPESVTDRCATKHEYAFHLTRQGSYFAAMDEIREEHQAQSLTRARRNRFAPDMSQAGVGSPHTLNPAESCHPLGALPGSVWSIPVAPLFVPEWLEHRDCCGGRKRPGCQDGLDHHAAFPPALARKCILGWSPSGICLECGEGRCPVTQAEDAPVYPWAVSQRAGRSWKPADGRALGTSAADRNRRITGYACACPDTSAPTRPAVIVDPFGGTGTTAMVADVLGRTGITIDRSFGYCRLSRWRTSDPAERARALGVPKPPPVIDGQRSLFDDLAGEVS